MALLPVAEARSRLLEGAAPGQAEMVDLSQAAGRVLAEPLKALRTQPPFDASAMDGYAVRAQDIATLPAFLDVIGEAPAGRPFTGRLDAGQAVRIFTGAPVPQGADTILIQEDAKSAGERRIEATESTAKGRHIRRAGLDFSEGELLLDRGRRLDPAALSLAASANHAQVRVWKRPLVAVLATGDELLPPGSMLGPGQIVSSNLYGVAAVVAAHGGLVVDLGIARDDRAEISAAVDRAIAMRADVLVTLGGASVGAHDLVREALIDRGMELDFWRIAMRPGKPFMFGRFETSRAIGLPGNPVASLVCSWLFLGPLVARLGGLPTDIEIRTGILGCDLSANDHREDYLRATVEWRGDRPIVTPCALQDSSMLSVLARSDALLIREPHAVAATAGSACRYIPLRQGKQGERMANEFTRF
ncbi:MAG: molybdopterin molybdotransferase MoeA [Rhizobiaceae bacterium]|nr:molybdopterin molybdotransferase MoeA [Rhizobiaceae bacterium]MCV0408612.1 molybdopterin molybdotransferase MoeA [Rhizobiaceae bacterium]